MVETVNCYHMCQTQGPQACKEFEFDTPGFQYRINGWFQKYWMNGWNIQLLPLQQHEVWMQTWPKQSNL